MLLDDGPMPPREEQPVSVSANAMAARLPGREESKWVRLEGGVIARSLRKSSQETGIEGLEAGPIAFGRKLTGLSDAQRR